MEERFKVQHCIFHLEVESIAETLCLLVEIRQKFFNSNSYGLFQFVRNAGLWGILLFLAGLPFSLAAFNYFSPLFLTGLHPFLISFQHNVADIRVMSI